MSILVRPTKRTNPNPILQAEEKSAVVSMASRYRPQPIEAPDAGYGVGEAPEGRDGREAGESRMSVLETPIYHGRSRS